MGQIKKYINKQAIVDDRNNLTIPFVAIAGDTGEVFYNEVPRLTNTITVIGPIGSDLGLIYVDLGSNGNLQIFNIPINTSPQVIDLNSYTEKGGVACVLPDLITIGRTIDYSNAKFKRTLTNAFKLPIIGEIDVSGLDVSDVWDANNAFYTCTASTIKGLNTWDTRNFIALNYCFYGMPNLTALDLSSMDVSKVYNFSGMCSNSPNLSSIDISTWKTYQPIQIQDMFSNTGISTFGPIQSTSNTVSTYKDMFYSSRVLTMVGTFANTPNLKYCNIQYFDVTLLNSSGLFKLFYNSGILSLSVAPTSAFSKSSSNIMSIQSMFEGCVALTSLIFPIRTTNLENMTDWLKGCTTLNHIAVNRLFFYSRFLTIYDFSGAVNWIDAANIKTGLLDVLPQLDVLGQKSLKFSPNTKAVIYADPTLVTAISSKNWTISD